MITSEKAAEFARLATVLEVSSVNSSLQVLRRVMRVAAEWGTIEVAPKIKMLPGQWHREHVVTPEEESRYFAAAPEPLASVAAVLIDTGLRPDECYRLRWENINWSNGRNGTFLVSHGKTAAARRVLLLTKRARFVLESRWVATGRPSARKRGHKVSKNNSIGAPKKGEPPTREQLQELLLRVLDGLFEEKNRTVLIVKRTPRKK